MTCFQFKEIEEEEEEADKTTSSKILTSELEQNR